MFMKFTASQSEVADLFQVERKKFLTSITRQEYELGKKPTKADKLKMAGTKEDKDEEKVQTLGKEESQPSQPMSTSEIDPEIPPLEDIPTPKKRLKLKDPASIPQPKHFQKK